MMPKSSFRAFLVALNIAPGIVVIAWLHSPPFGYQPLARAFARSKRRTSKAWVRKCYGASVSSMLSYSHWLPGGVRMGNSQTE